VRAQVHDDDAVGGLRLAVGLKVECRRHVKLGAHQPHELVPERRGEDRVAVGHHGLGHAVETYNVGEEGLRDGLGGVRMPQGNEVVVFAEPVHHREDDGLATDARQCLHDVQPDVRPDTLWDG